jgi:hypothetical protein
MKPGFTALVLGRPDGVVLDLPAAQAEPDLVLAFVAAIAEVAPQADAALAACRRGGLLWFAYPKKTGAIRTDITRDHGWDALAARGLLGVAQVAIDETWSALRFRYRDEIPRITRKEAKG